MGCGRAKVPEIGVGITGEERVSANLVAAPLTDNATGQVTNIIVVEAQQSTQLRFLQRLLGARNSVLVQASEIYTFFEVDVSPARCSDGTVPIPMWLDVFRTDDFRFSGLIF